MNPLVRETVSVDQEALNALTRIATFSADNAIINSDPASTNAEMTRVGVRAAIGCLIEDGYITHASAAEILERFSIHGAGIFNE